jgi:dihydropyrimidine dehydrogenase (NAD+) subunit PreT
MLRSARGGVNERPFEGSAWAGRVGASKEDPGSRVKHIARKLDDETYERNFADINPRLTETQAVAEGSRCLFCHDAPCIQACPTEIDIPSFIRKITTANLKGSARTILEANVLGHSCARVCPVEALCEGACVLNQEHKRPVTIGALQRHATDYVMDRRLSVLEAGPPNGKRVALIGAGPASFGCAAELARMGYACRIYEKRTVPGGLNTHGIAAYKMRALDALREVELVRSLGVEIRSGVEVGRDVTVADLRKEADAVFLGIGLGPTESLGLPGEDLPGVVDALRFIDRIKNEPFRRVDVGRTVVVIGAGNTSVDAATQAKRLGAENVIVLYRRGPEDVSAYHYEFELAKADGAVYVFFAAPVRFLGQGAVEGIECTRTEIVQENGLAKVRMVPGSEFQIPCDMAITAVGQSKALEWLNEHFPALALERGRVKVDREGRTGVRGVYAGGDCVNGGKEVVNAVADGKAAARALDRDLGQPRA